jgi:hypothetical protein
MAQCQNYGKVSIISEKLVLQGHEVGEKNTIPSADTFVQTSPCCVPMHDAIPTLQQKWNTFATSNLGNKHAM